MRKAAPIVPHRQLVVFRLGADHFGVDVLSIREVLRYAPLTPMPNAPDFVEGVFSVRGSTVPVIDLRRRFGLTDPEIGLETRILVVDLDGSRMGVIVDDVLDVRKVPESQISDPPPFLRGISAEYIGGVARMEDGLVVILEMGRVLTSDERIALESTDFDSTAVGSAHE